MSAYILWHIPFDLLISLSTVLAGSVSIPHTIIRLMLTHLNRPTYSSRDPSENLAKLIRTHPTVHPLSLPPTHLYRFINPLTRRVPLVVPSMGRRTSYGLYIASFG